LKNKDHFTEIENKCRFQPFGDGTASLKIADALKEYFEKDRK